MAARGGPTVRDGHRRRAVRYRLRRRAATALLGALLAVLGARSALAEGGVELRPTATRADSARTARRSARSEAALNHPLSTYRLQLTPQFTLDHARKQIDYLHRLGIHTLYLSPVLQARPGSQHGYDVTDPTRVNRELGGEHALRSLMRAASKKDMAVVLDVVPNHMGVGPDNRYWDDMLANGRGSEFAHFFDVDWGRTGRRKLVVPQLGAPLREVIDQGQLELSFEKDGSFRVHYFDKSYPVDARTIPQILELEAAADRKQAPAELLRVVRELRRLPYRTPAGAERGRSARSRAAQKTLRELFEARPEVRDRVERALASFNDDPRGRERFTVLMRRQPYRLEHWKSGSKRVNYRRFFSINDLAALRQEDPSVFEATLGKVFELAAYGNELGEDGGRAVPVHLRIDHPDGLTDPRGTLRAMGERLRDSAAPGSRIWVEAILDKDQQLPRSWSVAGTTGYDFLNQLLRAQVDHEGYEKIDRWYRREILGRPDSSFSAEVARGKREMVRGELAPDVGFIVDRLERLADTKLSRRALERAVEQLVVEMPVYRSYLVDGQKPREIDVKRIESAAERAQRALKSGPQREALALLTQQLLRPAAGSKDRRADRAGVVRRFQQLSAATMAKGLEDTAHYRDYAVAALNEVGGAPHEVDDRALDELHRANALRDPSAMLAATTHDTKRSADARSRLAVLTEMPEQWIRTVRDWRARNESVRGTVDANTEYLAYQMLVALWPRERERIPSQGELAQLRQRLEDYMIKAAREGKLHTDWQAPNETFERDLRGLLRSMFGVSSDGQRVVQPAEKALIGQVARFVREQVDRPAIWSSVARTLVHYTAPGTPDTYQGDELWNFSGVDPDNRRPVDYARRDELLGRLERFDQKAASEKREMARRMVEKPRTDALKMHVVRRALAARNDDAELFARGSYEELRTRGSRSQRLIAFARRDEQSGRFAITVAPRLVRQPNGKAPIGASAWADTRVDLSRFAGARVVDALTGRELTIPSNGQLAVSELLAEFPGALLVGDLP